jgi:FkbM family methyltransferase
MELQVRLNKKDITLQVKQIPLPTTGSMYFIESPEPTLYEFNQWRLNTFYHKEKETIKWVESISSNDVLWDIGANIGQYCIYGAKLHGVRCIAIEPEAQNFAMLTSNILVNELSKQITAYPIGLSSNAEYKTIDCNYEPATSFNSILRESHTKNGIWTDTIDNLVLNHNFPQPTYVKLDVDGVEHEILKGGEKVLRNVKSILVELHKEKDTEAIELIQSWGFRLTSINDRGIPKIANFIFHKQQLENLI